ncbi:MAG: InlB B-repeat-containing protein, partial [Ruminococcus sp.]|nr:InlB B-repeat-containing protein [Ruminococcus sp.]
MNLKRTLAAFLSAVLILLSCPFTAFADSDAPVINFDETLYFRADGKMYYGAYEVAFDGYLADYPEISVFIGNWEYMSHSNTLVLTNIDYTTTAPVAFCVESGLSPLSPLRIEQQSLNRFTSRSSTPTADSIRNSVTSGDSIGARFDSDVEFVGDGVFAAKGADFTSNTSFGIYANGCGIRVMNGTVSAVGGNNTGNHSVGIRMFYSELSVFGGTVFATAGTSINSSTYGISAENGVTQIGGKIISNAGNARDYSFGVYIGGGNGVYVSDGTLQTTASQAGIESTGLYVNNCEVAVEGGTLWATGGESSASYGIDGYKVILSFTSGGLILFGNTSNAYNYTKPLPMPEGDHIDHDIVLNNGEYSAELYRFTNQFYTLPEPSKKGYTFGGWYTDSSYTERVTLLADEIAPMTLYAMWTPITADLGILLNEQGLYYVSDTLEYTEIPNGLFGGGIMTYHKDARKLILENVNLTSSAENVLTIHHSGDLEIILIGSNSITGTFYGSGSPTGITIQTSAPLRISGSGTLNVQAGGGDGGETALNIYYCPQLTVSECTLNLSTLVIAGFSEGIELHRGDILICDKASVITAASDTFISYGISVTSSDSNIAVDDGYLEARAGIAEMPFSGSSGIIGIAPTLIKGTIITSAYQNALYNELTENTITLNELSLIRVRNDDSEPWEYIKMQGEYTDGDDWLYAQFTTDFAAVMLEADNDSEATEIFRFRDEFDELPTPVKEGYTFDGWYNGDIKITSISGLSGEVTLTAKWTENQKSEETKTPERETDDTSYNSYPTAYNPGDTQEFKSKTGITSTVTITDGGVEVNAGINKSGSVNSEATAAAVKKAAQIA